jgi:hypothetical protein
MATIKGGGKFTGFINRLVNKIGKERTLRVGFLEGSTFPDGTSVPMVAAIQNYGAPKVGIPPRPFFTNMVAAKSPNWGREMGSVLRAANYNGNLTLGRMGKHIKGQLEESIIDLYLPALSPVTVMLRGMKSNDSSLVVTGKTVGEARRRVDAGLTNYGASTKPLIEHGDMLRAIAAEIKTK